MLRPRCDAVHPFKNRVQRRNIMSAVEFSTARVSRRVEGIVLLPNSHILPELEFVLGGRTLLRDDGGARRRLLRMMAAATFPSP